LSGTKAFLLQAAEASLDGSGTLTLASQNVARLENLWCAPLVELRRETANHRLGIALTSTQTGLLDLPEAMCGIPLVQFLEELGFKVEVLLNSDEPGRLNWWLHSGLSAVFSDLSHDIRPISSGVAHFGLADLEPGFTGACRTARRLLGICETPFFRRYAQHTQRGVQA